MTSRLNREIVERLSSRTQFVVHLMGLAGLITRPIGHRGFWRLCRSVGKSRSDLNLTIRLNEDSVVRVAMSDPYWIRLVARAYEYEAEILHVLRRVRQIPFTFVDCGANIGYWSILASSTAWGARSTVAIEGSVRTCGRLHANNQLNGNRFQVIHAAVSDTSGTQTWFLTGDDHAGASLYDVGGSVSHREPVTTLALDDLSVGGATLIKLDVEGAEVQAINGAHKLLHEGALLLYEDHGADRTCAPTRVAFDLGLHVFSVRPNGDIFRVSTVDAVRDLKRRATIGYNFAACFPDSPFASCLG